MRRWINGVNFAAKTTQRITPELRRRLPAVASNELLAVTGEEHGAAIKDPYAKRYPLIEWDTGRDECLDTTRAAGLPLPGKSACFFCPNSKAHEILSLPQPLIDRALAIEANAELTAMKGLGRRWRWADLIRADRAQMDLFPCHAEMPCGCFDG